MNSYKWAEPISRILPKQKKCLSPAKKHIQKYYTPEGKRNQTVRNKGEVKSFYVSENHPAIVSEEEWQQVQELMQYHKKQRNIQSGDKYQRRYWIYVNTLNTKS